MKIPTNLFFADNSVNAQQRDNLVQEYDRKIEQLSEDQKLSKLCSDAGLKLVEQGQYFCTLDIRRRTTDATFMPRIYDASQ